MTDHTPYASAPSGLIEEWKDVPLHEAALPMNATPLHSESRLWQPLAARREAIAAQWTALACAVYPLGAAGFLRTNPDPFSTAWST